MDKSPGENIWASAHIVGSQHGLIEDILPVRLHNISYLGDGCLNVFCRPRQLPKLYIYVIDGVEEDIPDHADFVVKKSRSRKGKPRKMPRDEKRYCKNNFFVFKF